MTALKRKPTASTGGPAPQCRVHGTFAALGAAELVSAIKQQKYKGPIVTEWPLQQLPQHNVSRIAPARCNKVSKKSVAATIAARSGLGVNSKVGLSSRGGQFATGYARKADIALFSPEATLVLELNGSEHQRVRARLHDRDKENGAKLTGYRVHAVDVAELLVTKLWLCEAARIVKRLRRKQHG